MDIEKLMENYSQKLTADLAGFKKYNWVDVKEIAPSIFYNYGYELPWAEDMWNILMFSAVVNSDHVAPSNLTYYDYGDILVWLLSIQDLLYDYKVCLEHESAHRPEIIEYFRYYDDNESCVESYVMDDFIDWLNSLGWDTEEMLVDDDIYEVNRELLECHVKLRRDHIIKIIKNHFQGYDILLFMAGYHCCEHYYRLEDRLEELNKIYEQKIADLRGVIETNKHDDEIFEYENKLAELEDEREETENEIINNAPISLPCLLDLANLSIEEAFLGDIPCVVNWIENEMYRR